MTAHSAVAHVPALPSTPISAALSHQQTTAQLVPFHETQSDLVRAARRNRPHARARLIESFMPLIGSVARIYAHAPTVDRSELMQEGVVGMLRALERYDPELGTPFWAYASWWVRQAMQQVVSELSRPVVLSDRALRQLAHVREARRTFAGAHAREPSVQELAAASELTLAQLDRLSVAERSPRSLDEPLDDTTGEGGATFGDTLSDPWAEEAYEELGIRMRVAEVPRLLEQLSARERGVVEGRYGLQSRELTLRELGETMGISAERVRQIEQAALEKMRTAYSRTLGAVCVLV
jgi:RNA polymerase primary sigma factor